MKLLCVSNGHGEDAIAVRILEQLQTLPNTPEIAALPIVGEGQAYTKHHIPLAGTVKKMPSGGFIYMDGRQLWRDLQGGLIKLTLTQYQVIRQWGKSGGVILAVGDIVPLLLAWLSGANYAFVGTAKSEYYLRNESGWLPKTSFGERKMGSVYYPWERWLMSRPSCKAVFPRDALTTKVLQQWSIPAYHVGNPMMDGLTGHSIYSSYKEEQPLEQAQKGDFRIDTVDESLLPTPPTLSKSSFLPSLTVTLLPGSRPPEAYENWQQILQAVAGVKDAFSDSSVVFLGAIAPSLDLHTLQTSLTSQGWHLQPLALETMGISDHEALTYRQDNAMLILTQNAYEECLQKGECAIAMAGTATEQFVGLGKPAFTFPGKGPQFTPAFAEAQTRLLGDSVILVSHPMNVAQEVKSLWRDSERLALIAENGRRRMGKSGAALKIAQSLMTSLGSRE